MTQAREQVGHGSKHHHLILPSLGFGVSCSWQSHVWTEEHQGCTWPGCNVAGAYSTYKEGPKNHLSAACTTPCAPSIFLFSWLLPQHSRQEPVAAAAGSSGTTTKLTNACSCSAQAACLK